MVSYNIAILKLWKISLFLCNIFCSFELKFNIKPFLFLRYPNYWRTLCHKGIKGQVVSINSVSKVISPRLFLSLHTHHFYYQAIKVIKGVVMALFLSFSLYLFLLPSFTSFSPSLSPLPLSLTLTTSFSLPLSPPLSTSTSLSLSHILSLSSLSLFLSLSLRKVRWNKEKCDETY